MNKCYPLTFAFMSFFQNFDWSFKSIAKVIGLVLAGVVVVSIVIALFGFSIRTIFQTTQYGQGGEYSDSAPYAGAGLRMTKQGFATQADIAPMPPEGGYVTGTDAESYEVKTFSADVKTSHLEETCGKISALKPRADVIFETANVNDDNCNFSFKVKKEKEAEIVALIEGLKPDNLNANTQTIKGTIESFDKQLQILENKLASIEDTLTKSQRAYDEVTRLATAKQDVESLAKIIDSKLNLIERLSTQRIQVKQEIDQYKQGKSDELDRLNYSFFSVNILKDLIFDWKQIRDSWKFEMKAFVDNFNGVIQGISVNLLTYMIRFIQVAIYFFLSLFLLKYVWLATKKIWRR